MDGPNTMILRLDHRTGALVETSIPAPDDVSAEDIAHGVLALLPGVTRVRIWQDGLSFLDVPSADVSQAHVRPTPKPSDAVLDIATAVLLIEHDSQDEMQAPSWLRPYSGPGRPPATGTMPPV